MRILEHHLLAVRCNMTGQRIGYETVVRAMACLSISRDHDMLDALTLTLHRCCMVAMMCPSQGRTQKVLERP